MTRSTIRGINPIGRHYDGHENLCRICAHARSRRNRLVSARPARPHQSRVSTLVLRSTRPEVIRLQRFTTGAFFHPRRAELPLALVRSQSYFHHRRLTSGAVLLGAFPATGISAPPLQA